ncbi:MAG TPA: hypothetical protein VFG02_02365 [Nitrospirota bacterium]|nr:hypothetical protein [Nitrospirota bacterium]
MQELCFGGSTGEAFIKAAVCPMSMRQTTQISPAAGGGFPVTSEAIVAAEVCMFLRI